MAWIHNSSLVTGTTWGILYYSCTFTQSYTHSHTGDGAPGAWLRVRRPAHWRLGGVDRWRPRLEPGTFGFGTSTLPPEPPPTRTLIWQTVTFKATSAQSCAETWPEVTCQPLSVKKQSPGFKLGVLSCCYYYRNRRANLVCPRCVNPPV